MTIGQPAFAIRVPDSHLAGVYANVLSVWHTVFEFTLDFAVTLPAMEVPVPATLVARVKVPPTVVFDMIRQINGSLNQFEARFGPIRGPGDADPLPFPDEFMEGDSE